MASIGLVANAGLPAAVEVEGRIGRWLGARGHEARRLRLDEGASAAAAAELSGLDVVVTLGGDGTMLRAVRFAAPVGVPVLGVNLGHLGYLTAVEPGDLEEGLERFLSGNYSLDRRMTLEVSHRGPEGEGRHLALNDAVLQRPGGGHTIRIQVAVDDVPFVSFTADALIVSTPTGSTAYNLSARGPIVSPQARVQILTPVAPHALFDRSLVLDADERVTVRPEPGHPADLVVDGRHVGTLDEGGVADITAGKTVGLVRFEERAFSDILREKFSLGEW